MSNALNLNDLNPEQRAAVETVDGPLLLLAGAGTGKTRVITYRIAQLISTGIEPQHVLAVTFTNKAAREMKARVARLLSADATAAVTVGTFHAFCVRVLRQHIHLLGYSPAFGLASDAYQVGLVGAIMTELGHVGTGQDPRLWHSLISKAKGELQGPAELRARDDVDLAAVFELYERRMRQMDIVDFDDLLTLVVRLWEEKPEVLERHRERFRYLLIDEYQDTNVVQFQLMARLAGARRNICAVGDDDQSIYGWRGANLGNILQFNSHFPDAKVIRLEQNYRSTGTILTAANSVIAHNRERHAKALWSTQGQGEKILVVGTDDENAEAKFIVDVLRERKLAYGDDYSHFAVLFRSNHQSRALENYLRQARIPYRLVGARSFYQRKEILDAVSMLQAVQNPRDDLSFLRVLNVPPRGVGDASIERLKKWRRIAGLPLQELIGRDDCVAELPAAAATSLRAFHAVLVKYRSVFAEPGGLTAKIEALLEETGYLSGLGRMYKPRADALRRLDNVHEFLSEVGDFNARRGAGVTLADLLEMFALVDANDQEERAGPAGENAVTLMTVHAAKGLEFSVVCIVGMERGLFPHVRAVSANSEEEERRLFYVALTRAKREVILTCAERRRLRGSVRRRRRSPFLAELPPELVLERTPAAAFEPVSAETAADFIARMKSMLTPK